MVLQKKQLGYLEGGLSLFLNTVLFVLKLRVGTAAGSIAMVADAWHTLSDTLTSLVVVIGFWLSSRPKDREHPFGHGRAEVIGGIIIGILLAVVGAGFLRDSYLQLRSQEQVLFNTAALIVFGISVLTKEGIARYSIHLGRKLDSKSLIADGWHHRSDAIASAIILAGALTGRYFWWMDGVLGIAVSLLILRVAFGIVKDASRSVMGEPASEEMLENIQILVNNVVPEISDVHHVHIHQYGDHIEATLHARLPGNTSLQRTHDVASRLEDQMRSRLSMEATIHMEPEA